MSVFQILVEEFEFELLRRSFFKSHWDLKHDWFKTYAISVSLTFAEAEQILSNIASVVKQEEMRWGEDNLKVSLIRKAEPTLRQKLVELIEG